MKTERAANPRFCEKGEDHPSPFFLKGPFLIIVHTYGYVSTLFCLIINLLVVWLAFGQSQRILHLVKEGGSKGIGKVFSLLLAAFAMMIRIGLQGWRSFF